ncbi:MAG: M20/M25/M40 family metallo-hydrolase [Dysgonomonas sp.]|uniref:M20/M25/M40 family metallo-hydrolase n=1 Tax=unclassified Dysgonomonas TaxID=2630389 RepID=UPI0018848C5B|nr:M20/M25/M40 family metallo-hydrolase [Dysgonomonas sp. GY75]MBF0651491.1 hypothetical protein [Dysgonomonas sp. GY75]
MLIWRFDSAAENRLKDILEIAAPTSYEVMMGNYLRKIWTAQSLDVSSDVLGNVYASLPGVTPIHIGLVAHMDTIAVQISKVLPNGMLHFRSLGLIPQVMGGQKVNILSDNGLIKGIVGFDPLAQYGVSKGITDEDLWIDIGTSSAQESLSQVSIGDFVVLQTQYLRLGENRISASGLDDRIGLFIINECMRWFTSRGTSLCLHVIGSVQEEIGLRGVSVVTNHQHLDVCFVLDVDFATDIATSYENQPGELSLGKGIGMHRKADNNIVLQRIMRDVAEEKGFPYQISLGRRIYGGTDASVLQLQKEGIATMNINIPCRYMHSASEICDIRDIEIAVNLLIEAINRIAALNKKSFIPGID